MEEEMRQGMMGADVNTSPAAAKPMELTIKWVFKSNGFTRVFFFSI